MTKAHTRLVNSSGAMVEAEARRRASNTRNCEVAPASDSASSSAQSCRDGVFHTHGRMSPASTKKPRLVMSMLTLVGSESLVKRINMVEIDQSPAAQSASRTGPEALNPGRQAITTPANPPDTAIQRDVLTCSRKTGPAIKATRMGEPK